MSFTYDLIAQDLFERNVNNALAALVFKARYAEVEYVAEEKEDAFKRIQREANAFSEGLMVQVQRFLEAQGNLPVGPPGTVGLRGENGADGTLDPSGTTPDLEALGEGSRIRVFAHCRPHRIAYRRASEVGVTYSHDGDDRMQWVRDEDESHFPFYLDIGDITRYEVIEAKPKEFA